MSELFVTDVADVASITAVCRHVTSEMMLQRELFTAQLTGKWSLGTVAASMTLQVICLHSTHHKSPQIEKNHTGNESYGGTEM